LEKNRVTRDFEFSDQWDKVHRLFHYKRASYPLPELENRRFKLPKRSQLFIGVHHETLSVVAMRVRNEDCSPVAVHG
jgi:hypothetical protein